MRTFISYSSNYSSFVIMVASYLRTSLESIFFYENYEINQDNNFINKIENECNSCEVFIIFFGGKMSNWIEVELNIIKKRLNKIPSLVVFLNQSEDMRKIFLDNNSSINFRPPINVSDIKNEAFYTAREILHRLHIPCRFIDDLPSNPHLFSYEKDIIDFFRNQAHYTCHEQRVSNIKQKLLDGRKLSVTEQEVLYNQDLSGQESKLLFKLLEEKEQQALTKQLSETKQKRLSGCPSFWPEVKRWQPRASYENKVSDIGELRKTENMVVAAALSKYHRKPDQSSDDPVQGEGCLIQQNLCFPEAGPREKLYFPFRGNNGLKVAILVSGGIAPGINAVIDGIVQRHWLYAREHKQTNGLTIYGLPNGFRAFDLGFDTYFKLAPDDKVTLGDRQKITSDHANEGGSMLGTSRVDDLIIEDDIRINKLQEIVYGLRYGNIDILYVIGGDGSMKAAHALRSIAQNTPGAPLSVVAIPKTMDNDILWVWQAFGFLSAVEKAREVIQHLHTERTSNPRLCVIQLFGSDSGFVVSHSVLASPTGNCDAALIPEVPFSMKCLAKVIHRKMVEREQLIPHGLIVLAETAIPTDAIELIENKAIGEELRLSKEEIDAIQEFDRLRKDNKRIQGQTNDELRTAGLKIVSRGLPILLEGMKPVRGFSPDWSKMRVFTNEPRHLLRSISPSSSDIIFGQRLGMLAVDNAMAGYTDFMISQWLTEYVLVPLELVVLGRKRIPPKGIFWRSVLSKTGQPEDMVNC